MKKITYYILLVILLGILAGCRKTSQADALSPQSEMKTLFDELKTGYGAGMSNLTELYANQGQFEKAIEMLYDALDVFKSKNDYEGASGTCVPLTELFRQWGMMEESG